MNDHQFPDVLGDILEVRFNKGVSVGIAIPEDVTYLAYSPATARLIGLALIEAAAYAEEPE